MARRFRIPRRWYRSPYWTALVIVLLAVMIGNRLFRQPGAPDETAERFHVIKVVDGDTVHLTGGDKLRLAHIDTPEQGEPLYDEATALLTQLTLGKTLHLEFARPRRDKYGRMLASAFVDSIFVGEEILRHGLGYLMLFSQKEYDDPLVQRLLTAQRDAVKSGTGLHGLQRQPEDSYIAGQKGLRFHRPGCRLTRSFTEDQIRTFTSREQALCDGLSPCRSCKP
ncbi:MAG: thermonuclease family protein [bacterium]